MNGKDRDLIQSVLQAAGKAGEQGFAYLVHYKFVDGLVGIFGYLALVAFAAWLMKRVLAWKPKDDDAYIPRGAALVVICIVLACFIVGIFSCITEVLVPEGAAINSVLSH